MSILIETAQNINDDLGIFTPNHIYIPNYPQAPVPMAATIRNLCTRVQDLFVQKKANSFIYSHRGSITKSNRNRFRRVSRRELLCRFQQILLAAYDISTGELFDNILETSLALAAKTGLRNISRLIKLFKKRGWIEVHQRSKEGINGRFALPAKKYLTPTYFQQVLGEDSWDMVCQYKRWWSSKHGEQNVAKSYKKRLASRASFTTKLDWKEEALKQYKTEATLSPNQFESVLQGLTKNKTSVPYGRLSIADSQRPIYKEDYYESYHETPVDFNANRSVSIQSPVDSSQPPILISPTHACHKDFKAPEVSQSLEERREAARKHMATIKAKLGMKSSSGPP